MLVQSGWVHCGLSRRDAPPTIRRITGGGRCTADNGRIAEAAPTAATPMPASDARDRKGRKFVTVSPEDTLEATSQEA